MRLITHNLLACHAKTCQAPANFPLRFADCTRVEMQEAEFNAEFMRCVAPSITQCRAARQPGVAQLDSQDVGQLTCSATS